MYKIVGFLLFLCFCKVEAAVYDCFLFFNEDEVLRIHLEELYEHVDYFVLVEANQTFSGVKKEYRFSKIQDAYQKYLDKIIYVEVDEWLQEDNPWVIERFHRNQILRGLEGCAADDIVIIADVDEIVKGRDLQQIISKLRDGIAPVIGCACDFYRWFLNRKDPDGWVGPAITTFEVVSRSSPEDVRGCRSSYFIQSDAAWHFSNMGGLRTFVEKISSFSHFRECDPSYFSQHPEELYHSLQRFALVPIDASFPKYIQENQQYYLELNLLDRKNGSYY